MEELVKYFGYTIEEFIETFDLNICRLVIIGQNYPEYNLKLMTEHLSYIDLENIRYPFSAVLLGNAYTLRVFGKRIDNRIRSNSFAP